MNEHFDLTETLKDCPKGTKLYSTIYGEVELDKIIKENEYPIILSRNDGSNFDVTADGRYFKDWDGDCTLFPSRDDRDWYNFKPKKPKFDPNTLKAFDKVLVKGNKMDCVWKCSLHSHFDANYRYSFCANTGIYRMCIPYNDETKHLVGTTEEAPEYYRYWED